MKKCICRYFAMGSFLEIFAGSSHIARLCGWCQLILLSTLRIRLLWKVTRMKCLAHEQFRPIPALLALASRGQ